MRGETAYFALFDSGYTHCFGETPEERNSDLTPFRARGTPDVGQIAMGGCRTGG